jgi:predicted O-methyltransferase YrrM
VHSASKGPDLSVAGGFEHALAAVDDIRGWLTESQARMLWDAAHELGEPTRVVEIGSYHGRSAIVLARAIEGQGSVVAIDPHAGNDRGPQESEEATAGEADNVAFMANLVRAGVERHIRHVRLTSREALRVVDGTIDLLYVDGAHDYRAARADIRHWGARVRPGGELLVHDSFSSVGVTLALLRELVFGGRYRYEGRAGSLARYRRESLSVGAHVANCARQLVQLGWFARNLVVKVALVTLGQRDLSWPY